MSSKTSSFFRAFRFIDIFGLKTEFQIDQKPKFQTTSGGVFTLIYIGFIILLFFSFGSDMFNRLNPDTSVSQIYQPSPGPTWITKDQYSFVFGMQDSNGNHFIDEEIYTATLFYGHRDQTTKQDQLDIIPLERCSQADMPNNPKIQEYYNNIALSLSDLYCISSNYTGELVIQGAWDQAQFNYLELFIAPCNSSQRTCKSEKEINDMLKTSFYAFYSVDHLFDLRNYQDPAQEIGRDYFTETTTSLKKIISRYLKTTHVSDDSGWITDDTTVKDHFSFDSDKESFELLTQTDYLVDFIIRKSAYETILTRKYKKIQNVFAEMTGFLQIIFTALFMFSNPFIKKEYYESLTNSIYNFEVDEEVKKKKRGSKKKKSKGAQHHENMQTFRTLMMDKEKEMEIIQDDKNSVASIKKDKEKKKGEQELANKLFKLKESPLNLGFMDLFKSLFISESELDIKKNQRNKGVSSIFAQLDIKYILKKFAEIDKLKLLLLNEDQHHLFEYLPKPIIMKNTKISFNYVRKSLSPAKISISRSSTIAPHNDLVLKAKTVQRAYENIIKKTEMTELDKKLIESLDEGILALLQTNIDIGDNPDIGIMSGHEKREEVESGDGQGEKESVFAEKKENIEIIITDRKAGNPSVSSEIKEENIV